MLNICFSMKAMNALRQAVAAGYLIESQTVCIPDDLSLGDISNLKNFETRKNILSHLYQNEEYEESACQKCYRDFFSQLNVQDKILIWYADTPAEYSGLLYTLWLLRGKRLEVKAICCSRTLKRGENQFVSYYSVSDVAPEEMIRFLPFEEGFSEEGWGGMATEWERLAEENGELRVYWNRSIQTADVSYYDATLFRYASRSSEPAIKLIERFQEGERLGVNHAFLLSRIESMVKRGLFSSEKEEIGYQTGIRLSSGITGSKTIKISALTEPMKKNG